MREAAGGEASPSSNTPYAEANKSSKQTGRLARAVFGHIRFDIQRTARLWIQRHGADATAKAREKVDKMRNKNDVEGADVWLRIVAIGTLRNAAN
jgi:hypothetical protein